MSKPKKSPKENPKQAKKQKEELSDEELKKVHGGTCLLYTSRCV